MRYLLDPAWFWMLLGEYEDEPIVFDQWQIAHLHDYSRIRMREKAPQIGFSWLCAAEAVWEALLFEDSVTGFISMDQREAQNKILYARKLYDGLPRVIQEWIPVVRDAMEAIDFGTTNRPSQLISLPATAGMRGRRMNVVLDECDFYKDGGMAAYRAGIGRIARGGRLTAGSTCFGTGTLLDRNMQGYDEDGGVVKEAAKVSKGRFPWTVVENPMVLESIGIARSTLDPNDFAEEYECVRDGALSDPFPAEMLRAATHDEDTYETEGGKLVIPDEQATMVAGYDVGKGAGRNPSILSLFERRGDKWLEMAIHQPSKLNGSPLKLPEQHEWLVDLLERCPNLRLVPDAQGIGAHIAQALVRRFGERRVIAMIAGSKPKGLKPQDKNEMVTDIKRALEAGELYLMADKEQYNQFRRTKRTTGGYAQMGSSKRDHFDKFWGAAYAQYGIAASAHFNSAYRRHGLIVIGMEEDRFGSVA